jgi:hypothetical protein
MWNGDDGWAILFEIESPFEDIRFAFIRGNLKTNVDAGALYANLGNLNGTKRPASQRGGWVICTANLPFFHEYAAG